MQRPMKSFDVLTLSGAMSNEREDRDKGRLAASGE